MAREKYWSGVGPLVLTSNGGTEGEISVTSTRGLFVKQTIHLISSSIDLSNYEIKRVLSPTQIKVGKKGTNINKFEDVSALLTSDSAYLIALEQSKPNIPTTDMEQALFAEEPIVARRVIPVDTLGNFFTTDNPFPVQLSDGSINIGTVNAELEVQLTHLDDDPDSGDIHDSIRLGDGVEELEVNPDGSINVNIIPSNTESLIISEYAEITAVAASTPTNIVSYIVPVATLSFLQKISVSGSNIAKYVVKLNGTTIDQKRTYFGGSLNENFDFSDASKGLLLNVGDSITVEVEHNRPMVGDFNGRIQIIQL